MTKLLKSLAILAALSAPVVTFGAVQKGLMEVDVSASYSSLDANGADLDLFIGGGSFGYFVSDNFELTTTANYLYADFAGDDLDALLLGGAGDFHFNTQSDFVPFVGAALYWVNVDFGFGSEDDWAWEARAGVKHFIAENVALRYQISYLSFDDLDLDGLNVGMGISFFF